MITPIGVFISRAEFSPLPFSALLYNNRVIVYNRDMKKIDYKEKIARVENHVKMNPCDYQSVISLYKMKSKQIEHDRQERQVERLKKISEFRRML